MCNVFLVDARAEIFVDHNFFFTGSVKRAGLCAQGLRGVIGQVAQTLGTLNEATANDTGSVLGIIVVQCARVVAHTSQKVDISTRLWVRFSTRNPDCCGDLLGGDKGVMDVVFERFIE